MHLYALNKHLGQNGNVTLSCFVSTEISTYLFLSIFLDSYHNKLNCANFKFTFNIRNSDSAKYHTGHLINSVSFFIASTEQQKSLVVCPVIQLLVNPAHFFLETCRSSYIINIAERAKPNFKIHVFI